MERRGSPSRRRHRGRERRGAPSRPAARVPPARPPRWLASVAAGRRSSSRRTRSTLGCGAGRRSCTRPAAATAGALATSATSPGWRNGRVRWAPERSSSTRCTRWRPVHPQQSSPYYPSSRLWRNPLYLAVEQLPGADALGDELARLANAGRALNGSRIIDRDAVLRLKRVAFERLFEVWSRKASEDERAGFSSYCTSHGEDLRRFTTYCGLAERHGGGWPAWPPSYRSPDGGRVKRFAREHETRLAAPRLAAVAARRAARRGGLAGRGARRRPRGRVRSWGRGRVELAEPARPRRACGRSARRLQPARPGLGTSAFRPLEAPSGPLRAVDRDRPRGDAIGGRTPRRPRDGPVPVVLDPRERVAPQRRLRPRPRERAARPARTRKREVGHVRRRRGPRHGGGRSARGSGASVRCSPRGFCGSKTPSPSGSRCTHLRRSPLTTSRRLRARGPAPISRHRSGSA